MKDVINIHIKYGKQISVYKGQPSLCKNYKPCQNCGKLMATRPLDITYIENKKGYYYVKRSQIENTFGMLFLVYGEPTIVWACQNPRCSTMENIKPIHKIERLN